MNKIILVTLLTLALTSCVTTKVVNEKSVSFDDDGNIVSTYTYASKTIKTSVDNTSAVGGFFRGIIDIGTDDNYVYIPSKGTAYDKYDETTFSEKVGLKWNDKNDVNVKSTTTNSTKVGKVNYKKSKAEKAHKAGKTTARNVFFWIWEHFGLLF